MECYICSEIILGQIYLKSCCLKEVCLYCFGDHGCVCDQMIEPINSNHSIMLLPLIKLGLNQVKLEVKIALQSLAQVKLEVLKYQRYYDLIGNSPAKTLTLVLTEQVELETIMIKIKQYLDRLETDLKVEPIDTSSWYNFNSINQSYGHNLTRVNALINQTLKPEPINSTEGCITNISLDDFCLKLDDQLCDGDNYVYHGSLLTRQGDIVCWQGQSVVMEHFIMVANDIIFTHNQNILVGKDFSGNILVPAFAVEGQIFNLDVFEDNVLVLLIDNVARYYKAGNLVCELAPTLTKDPDMLGLCFIRQNKAIALVIHIHPEAYLIQYHDLTGDLIWTTAEIKPEFVDGFYSSKHDVFYGIKSGHVPALIIYDLNLNCIANIESDRIKYINNGIVR